jgi:hypothetical protein
MALIAVTKGGMEYRLHIGEKVIVDVIEVQADGHELELIRNTFNVPCVKGKRIQRWYGDYAKYIAGNW